MSSGSSLGPLLSEWSFEPQIVLALLLVATIYLLGLRELGDRDKLWHLVRRWHVAAFFSGLVVLGLALLSPLDALDTRLFSVHMIQHLLLLQLAPLLLLLGKPIPVLLVGLPQTWVRAVARAHRRTAWLHGLSRLLTAPTLVWSAYVGDLLVWHVPAFYNATLRDSGVHLLEHSCFLFTSVLFWWIVVEPLPGPSRLHTGLRLLFEVTAMMPMTLLAALFTFADHLWYLPYAGQSPLLGWSPLDDQRLGGLIMWLPGSFFFMGTATILFFQMMAQDERRVEEESLPLTPLLDDTL